MAIIKFPLRARCHFKRLTLKLVLIFTKILILPTDENIRDIERRLFRPDSSHESGETLSQQKKYFISIGRVSGMGKELVGIVSGISISKTIYSPQVFWCSIIYLQLQETYS